MDPDRIRVPNRDPGRTGLPRYVFIISRFAKIRIRIHLFQERPPQNESRSPGLSNKTIWNPPQPYFSFLETHNGFLSPILGVWDALFCGLPYFSSVGSYLERMLSDDIPFPRRQELPEEARPVKPASPHWLNRAAHTG